MILTKRSLNPVIFIPYSQQEQKINQINRILGGIKVWLKGLPLVFVELNLAV